jgi:hypothetical protein
LSQGRPCIYFYFLMFPCNICHYAAPTFASEFAEWWLLAVRTGPRQLRKCISLMIMLTAWWIWKHRTKACDSGRMRGYMSSPTSPLD